MPVIVAHVFKRVRLLFCKTMGKFKSKSSAVERRRKKKSNAPSVVQSNPFEVRVNKEKYAILGRKSKHDKGLPGLSRSKAIKKRKNTLLQEYKKRNKSSLFIDKRFGEYNNDMSLEEKMLQRFTLEKQKHHERRGLYNLDDDEGLTHYGQSLADLDNFDDADLQLTDNEEEEENAEDTHFGGFLEKADKPYNERKEANEPKSRKEIMEEVVAKSKLKKMERQQAQEEAFQLTQDLDSTWKAIHGLLPKREDNVQSKADDYDILVRQLMYEKKATPTERLKTEEEIAKEEMEKLRKLEEDRLLRMHLKEESKRTHISADDLGERYSPVRDERVELVFKDGKMVLPEGTNLPEDASDDSTSIENENDDNNEDDDDDDDDSDAEMGREGESDDGAESPVSPITADDESELDTFESGHRDATGSGVANEDGENSKLESNDNRKGSKSAANNMSEVTNDEKELPYTFEAPKNLDWFLQCVEGWSYDQQLCIIDRIRKCHPPKVEEKNKKKMEAFFCILLNYIDHICDQSPIPMTFINKLAKPIFNLANDSPHNATREIQRRLRLMFKRFWVRRQTTGGRNITPGIKEIILLAIISTIYPTSDLRHGVATPALVYMAAVLSKSYFQTSSDLLSGLFISERIFEFVSLSKRFVPEVVNFLCGVLSMASRKDENFKYSPLFKIHMKSKNCLLLDADAESNVPGKLRFSDIVSLKDQDLRHTTTEFKLQSVKTCLHLIKLFANLYEEHLSFKDIFLPIKICIDKIPVTHYPVQIQNLFLDISGLFTVAKNLQPLTLQARKPVPLPLLEPKFDEKYEMKSKKKAINKDINEREKLKYKYKKEMKGAIREIRRDSQFLAKEKLQERLERDAERARKTKEIERQLAEQQGEINALDRVKKKKKR